MTTLLLAATILSASTTTTPGIAERWDAAWRSGDRAAVAALFTDDATIRVVYDPALPERKRMPDGVVTGRDAIADWSATQLAGWSGEGAAPAAGAAADEPSWSESIADDRLRSLGLDRAEERFDARLRDGRIESLAIGFEPATSQRLIAAIPDDDERIVRRVFDRLSAHDFSVIDETLSPAFVQHTVMPTGPGPAGVREFYRSLAAAFPDFRLDVEDVIAARDRVVVRATFRGTQKGAWLGVAASGRAATLGRIDVFRFVDGRCVEHWDETDRLGLLQQLGAVPKLPRWTSSPGYDDGIR